MNNLSNDWMNEAYVSVHLVQEILRHVTPPTDNKWFPEHRIDAHNRVDFYIKDKNRRIEFFVEVKAAKSPTQSGINNAARQQLANYFSHTSVKYGILIDPFGIECYQVVNNYAQQTKTFSIDNPHELIPAIQFLRNYLNELTKMRTITIHTSKGGVGKTTLTVNVAFELAKRGNRVLVVDLDNQANTSLLLGVNRADELDKAKNLSDFETILKSFEDRKEVIDFINDSFLNGDNLDFKDYIYPSPWSQSLIETNDDGEEIQIGCIDVLPSSYRTEPYSLKKSTFMFKYLNDGLEKVREAYDYVIIDTAPAFNDVTLNGLFAGQYLLVPSQMEYLSTYGIRQPIKEAKEIRKNMNGMRANILGIVPMMTDATLKTKTIRDLVRKNFEDIPLLPDISRKTAVGQSLLKRLPLAIFAEKNKSKSALDVARESSDLTQRIIERIDEISLS